MTTATSPSLIHLAWRQLLRDFRAGELRLLIVAVTLAVAALTAVGFFVDRINLGLVRDAAQLLGGDAIVVSDQPLPKEFADKAAELKLKTSHTATFPSMARAPDAKGGATRLVGVKGVTDGYPLRGAIRLADAPGGGERAVQQAPERGSVWVDPGLLDALQLTMGDELLLGDASLRIAKVIANEPDRGVGFMSFSPRVMLHEADLAATALVQPASRVTYRFGVAGGGTQAPVRAFVRWADERVKQQSLRGVRVQSLEAGSPERRQTLDGVGAGNDRAEKFLNLVALLAALLAAVAVGVAARDFAASHLDDCAMLRVLGQPQRAIAGQYLIEFAAVGLLASIAGVAIGFGVHFAFVWLLAGLVNTSLPAASVWPALFGLSVGFTLLIGFGLPPVLQLARVPPLRVIRRDVGGLKPASLSVMLAGIAGFVVLLLAVSSDLKLGAIAVGGFAGAALVFALLSWLAVQLLRRAVPEARAPRWLVLATRQIAARPAFAVLQVSTLSLGLLALCLLVLLRTDLIESWRRAAPADAPNRFVINIQPDQGEAFQARLRAGGVKDFDWYPMIRGRLVAVNGKAVSAEAYAEDRARRLLEREFNLSHSAEAPSHNQIVAGRWVREEPNGLSVEEGLAETLHLKLGDALRFDMGGIAVEARITSLRKVDWGSMRANFFVMFPHAAMPELPATYISAFRAPSAASAPGFDGALSREFPNITNVDVTASLAQFQAVINQVVHAVEFLFTFTLAAGLVVLVAAITATREARAREFAVMRALGASGVLLARVQRAELLGIGALAGFLASTTALAIGWALAKYVFEFSWSAPLWVPLAGATAGASLALATGWWGLREVLRRPVVETLRRASAE